MSNGTSHLGGRRIEVQAICRLSAPAERVWALIGNFAAPEAWLPAIRHVEMLHKGVGGIRVCQTDLGCFREQLSAMGRMWCAYTILDGPLPVRNYAAVIIAQPSANSLACRLQWKSAFDAASGTELSAARRQIARIYYAGLRALQARFGSDDTSPLFHAGGIGDVPLDAFLDISG
jgi:Polyketide cyclase / dehydrase and lipid transport